jgi:signal transduction histidine kinase
MFRASESSVGGERAWPDRTAPDRPAATIVYPASGGEMEALMRAKDWSQTRLGVRDKWPQSLKTALSIVLSSRFPMIVFWGPELCVLYNDAYIPIFANKHPDVLGKPGVEAWGEVWDVIGPMFDAVMRRGETTWSNDQLLFLRRKGFAEETYFTWSYSPITDETGGVGGVFTSVIETTARVLGERRLKTLRELAEGSTRAADVAEAYALSARIIGENLHDVPFGAIFAGADGELSLRASWGVPEGHRAASPRSWGVTLTDGTPEGTVIELAQIGVGEISSAVWPDPVRQAVVMRLPSADPARPHGLLVAGTSPRLELDAAYRQFLTILAHHVGNNVSNAAAHQQERRRAEALAEVDRAKTAFFSNVSHEFRTPLTLMLGQTEDALGSAGRRLEGEALESVHRSELRLLKLVNTLLDFSRIESGSTRPSFEPTDLSQLTRDLASTFRSAMERAGLRLEVDCAAGLGPVLVDCEMWEKIVLNLLSNALKFTLEGRVTVRLRGGPDIVVLEVSDTGVGIPAADLPRIFDRFHRVQGLRARSHEGSGIGLALVHELVRTHGGSVSVASEVGKGTTFTVSVPRRHDHLPGPGPQPRQAEPNAIVVRTYVEEATRWMADRAPSSSPAPHADPAARLVLVADDNADMREYATRILTPRWRVHAVSNGREALEAARRLSPDLIVSDVMMPGLDGFGLLRELRADERTRSIPFIMLSARAGESARVQGVEAGADDYLVKPFSARELAARVALHLQLSDLRLRAEAARDAAESASRAKDEFLAMLGHELRNPLSPMLTALQLLRMRDGKASREQEVLERQLAHLTRLVDDLLDVSRITGGKIDLRRRSVDLADVVARAVEIASPLIEQRRHRLDVQVRRGVMVDVDVDRMAQVVSNLLTNAAKYSEPASRIDLVAGREGDRAYLRVKDEGVGIEPAMLDRIFDMFVQRPQTIDRAQGGLGLGLAIVKSLVRMHGGTVSVRSEGVGKGSEFTVHLPVVEATHEPRPAVSDVPRRPGPGRKRVLVVDDNVDSCDLLKVALEHLGYTVETANDGVSALEVAKRFDPEVALVDIGLPVMTGYELAPKLRELRGGRALGLVAITGYGQERDRRRSAEAGFDAHLVKPVNLSRLEEKMKELEPR